MEGGGGGGGAVEGLMNCLPILLTRPSAITSEPALNNIPEGMGPKALGLKN